MSFRLLAHRTLPAHAPPAGQPGPGIWPAHTTATALCPSHLRAASAWQLWPAGATPCATRWQPHLQVCWARAASGCSRCNALLASPTGARVAPAGSLTCPDAATWRLADSCHVYQCSAAGWPADGSLTPTGHLTCSAASACLLARRATTASAGSLTCRAPSPGGWLMQVQQPASQASSPAEAARATRCQPLPGAADVTGTAPGQPHL